MGILFVVFAASMAAATFIENDYGSSAAYNFVYDTRWFELILLLLAVNLAGQMIIYKLYKKSKLTILLFHVSFILIISRFCNYPIHGMGGINSHQGRRGAEQVLFS